MLDTELRTAILQLHAKGLGTRRIARTLGVGRKTVHRVLESGNAEVPTIARASSAEPFREQIQELYVRCEGNLVRVQEELQAVGVELAYSTLTSFCRREGIGTKPVKPTGHYHFGPGEEMQHDTSPHHVCIDGQRQLLQCASIVLCYSRMRYVQLYPRWNRFYCKVFLTEALQYFGGSAAQCMLDNASVIIVRGTGKNAVPAPEMETFAKRFGFKFVAHEKGDANRSARVEGPFYHVERNFYPGRTFRSLKDTNAQLLLWCDKVNATFKRSLHASPRELMRTEAYHLKPLPPHIPEVYAIHRRLVSSEGYIWLHLNRYSVPYELIGQHLDVRETFAEVRVYRGHTLLATHEREPEGAGKRSTLSEHRDGRRWVTARAQAPSTEEQHLSRVAPKLAEMIELLKHKYPGRALRPIRHLYRLYLDYPTEILCQVVGLALHYGLCDLDRIERMVLRQIGGDYFNLPSRGSGMESEDDGHG